MDDATASAHAERIHRALVAAEAKHPNSKALAALHGALEAAWRAYHAVNPGVVQPFDGTDKPPPKP